jgi:thiamine-phosphate pyrophosphorylase
VGADGTHLGADDLPVAAARKVAGPGHLIGGTARDPVRARQLVAEGADYLGVGPAYPTTTKSGLPARSARPASGRWHTRWTCR